MFSRAVQTFCCEMFYCFLFSEIKRLKTYIRCHAATLFFLLLRLHELILGVRVTNYFAVSFAGHAVGSFKPHLIRDDAHKSQVR